MWKNAGLTGAEEILCGMFPEVLSCAVSLLLLGARSFAHSQLPRILKAGLAKGLILSHFEPKDPE